ncbi:MAG: hypothetical protein FJ112_01255 [Deltaproteobacteria bacterium]|nr:hypothetical protein [Deltaproteobacteria bacterium]
MGYSVSKDKKSFRVIFESWEDGKKTKRHVKKSEWKNLGFSLDYTIEQAKDVAHHLNADLKIAKQEKQRNRIELRRQKENLKECAHLPLIFVEEFERDVIEPKQIRTDHWESAKK